MAERYWELFLRTGLPLFWLLCRLEQERESEAAWAENGEKKLT